MFRKFSVFACAALCAAAIAMPAIADHHEGGEMPPMGAPAQMKDVAFMQGNWNVEFSYRMDPAAEFTTAAATAQVTSELDGCIQRMYFKGDMMGMTMHGEETLTFNRETGKYESHWVDNFSANAMFSSGTMEGNVLTMSGEGIQMGQPYLYRNISTKVSDDEVTWKMEMSYDNGETWFVGLKSTYKRAQT